MVVILLVGDTTRSKEYAERYNAIEFSLNEFVKRVTHDIHSHYGMSLDNVDEHTSFVEDMLKRDVDNLVWCRCVHNIIRKQFAASNIIISGIRFDEEIEYFSRKYENVIRINADDNSDDGDEYDGDEYDDEVEPVVEPIVAPVVDGKVDDEFQTLPVKRKDVEPIAQPECLTLPVEPVVDDEFQTLPVKRKDVQPECLTLPIRQPVKLDYSAPQKGVIGEEYVFNMITSIRPKFETTMVSHTGHLCDIHSVDYDTGIQYVFEIKLKQVITREDLNKFVRDIENIKGGNDFTVVGIFVSLVSENIVTIGRLAIDDNTVYLTKDFVTSEVFDVLFNIFPSKIALCKRADAPSSVTQFEIPQTVINTIAQLRAQYASITREKELYEHIKTNSESNISHVLELLNNLALKEQFIKMLNDEFNAYLPTVNVDTIASEEQRLRDYIKSKNGKQLQKKDILSKFPTLKTQLGGMLLKQIVEKYSA